MKKLVCILAVICFSVSVYAGAGRKYVASLDNSQVVRDQKMQRSSTRNFSSGKRYTAVTRRHGFHPFGGRSGGSSRPESGLGL